LAETFKEMAVDLAAVFRICSGKINSSRVEFALNLRSQADRILGNVQSFTNRRVLNSLEFMKLGMML